MRWFVPPIVVRAFPHVVDVARAFYAAFPDRDFFGSAKELMSKCCSSMDQHRNLLVGMLMLDLDHFACDASRLR